MQYRFAINFVRHSVLTDGCTYRWTEIIVVHRNSLTLAGLAAAALSIAAAEF